MGHSPQVLHLVFFLAAEPTLPAAQNGTGSKSRLSFAQAVSPGACRLASASDSVSDPNCKIGRGHYLPRGVF